MRLSSPVLVSSALALLLACGSGERDGEDSNANASLGGKGALETGGSAATVASSGGRQSAGGTTSIGGSVPASVGGSTAQSSGGASTGGTAPVGGSANGGSGGPVTSSGGSTTTGGSESTAGSGNNAGSGGGGSASSGSGGVGGGPIADGGAPMAGEANSGGTTLGTGGFSWPATGGATGQDGGNGGSAGTVASGAAGEAEGGGSAPVTAGAGGEGSGQDECPGSGTIEYVLNGVESWPADVVERLSAAMEEGVWYYNCYSNLSHSLTVNYSAGVPTAEANVDGWMSFGSDPAYQVVATVMHEIGHTMAVGYSPWEELSSNGRWTGRHVVEFMTSLLPEQKDPDEYSQRDYITIDGMHFWPYGLNYASEHQSEWSLINHVRIVDAMNRDKDEFRNQ